jgi:hypothetical protein
MTFDLPTVKALVQRLAARIVPGWTITCALAPSVEANMGGLAMIDPCPERQTAHVTIAPHPPDEDYEETIAHELTHAMLSPITQLVKRSSASVMLEEQIVERIGKLLVGAPDKLRRAVVTAVSNPRTTSPALRFRISALASRRRIEGKRTMADGSRLAELAMKAGEMGAREDVPEDVRALLAEFVAELAGGGAPASKQEPQMREDDPAKQEPQMREGEMPPEMRTMMRMAQRHNASSLEATIRLRLHVARTVDRIELDAETEKDLASCKTLDQFEREFKLVTRQAAKVGEHQRKRSGITPDATNGNGAPSMAALIEEGMSEPLARSIQAAYAVDKENGELALTNARKRLPAKTGGAR